MRRNAHSKSRYDGNFTFLCWTKTDGCRCVKFRPDMPKLLFVGIVERTCRAAVIREIPGITECFSSKEDGKKGEKSSVKVRCWSKRMFASG